MVTVRMLLDKLPDEALMGLYELRGRPSGWSADWLANDEFRSRLARSYRGKITDFLEDLRHKDLVELLRYRFRSQKTGKLYRLKTRHTFSVEVLRQFCIDLFVNRVIPSEFEEEIPDGENEDELGALNDEDEEDDADIDPAESEHPYFSNLTTKWSKPRQIRRILRILGIPVPQRLREGRFLELLSTLKQMGIEAAPEDGDGTPYTSNDPRPSIHDRILLRIKRASKSTPVVLPYLYKLRDLSEKSDSEQQQKLVNFYRGKTRESIKNLSKKDLVNLFSREVMIQGETYTLYDPQKYTEDILRQFAYSVFIHNVAPSHFKAKEATLPPKPQESRSNEKLPDEANKKDKRTRDPAGRSYQDILQELFEAGGEYTLEELAEALGTSPQNTRVAVSILRKPRGSRPPVEVFYDREKRVYRLGNEAEVSRAEDLPDEEDNDANDLLEEEGESDTDIGDEEDDAPNQRGRGNRLYEKSCGELLEEYLQENTNFVGYIQRKDILDWFAEHYPELKRNTILTYLVKYTTNNRSRAHLGAKPEHDLLFRENDDWSRLRRYRPGLDPAPIYQLDGEDENTSEIEGEDVTAEDEATPKHGESSDRLSGESTPRRRTRDPGGRSYQDILRELFLAGGEYTSEQLAEFLGTTPQTASVAVAILRKRSSNPLPVIFDRARKAFRLEDAAPIAAPNLEHSSRSDQSNMSADAPPRQDPIAFPARLGEPPVEGTSAGSPPPTAPTPSYDNNGTPPIKKAPSVAYQLEARAAPPLLGMNRIQLRVIPTPGAPADLLPDVLDMALRVPGAPEFTVVLKDAPQAFLHDNRVWVPVQEEWTELLFILEGPQEASLPLEIFHRSGRAAIAPISLEASFVVTRVIPPPAWYENISDEGVRKVLMHLEKHGSINEVEMLKLLGTSQKVRRFSNRFEEYTKKVPFRVRIEFVANIKRYIKEGEV